jgi:alpha-beta hydrolase superfamily lysophospholipase
MGQFMLKQFALAAFLAVAATSQALAAADVEVEINGGLGPLKGSLLMPDGNAPVPAVLIIPGSGPTDRNGNQPGMTNDALKRVAEQLAGQGIASLRIDKRGVAASARAAAREEDLRFETYIDDAVAWIKFLKQQKRIANVIVLGHSEGALIGTIAAQRTDVAGFISLAGPGFRAGEALRRQLGPQLPPDLKTRAFAVLAELEAGRTVASPPPELVALFRPSVQPYLISWFKYDPAAELAKLNKPVLIVQGTTDIQVGVDDPKALAAAKPEAKLVLIEGMNHILRAAPTDRAANVATYTNAALPLKPELMPTLASFVQAAK